MDNIENIIENFDLNKNNYISYKEKSTSDISTTLHENEVFYRSFRNNPKISINFNRSRNSKVYIGENIAGQINININGNDSIIYIGNNCRLDGLSISSAQNNDRIIIGNNVTTTANNRWISGAGTGSATPSIIIGDDCLFAYNIEIRNGDSHPIINMKDGQQVNTPKRNVIIEPHVWICAEARILKDVTIGANSIVALGTIVTKDMPRFSIASGVPAKILSKPDDVWCRTDSPKDRETAENYYRKYQ